MGNTRGTEWAIDERVQRTTRGCLVWTGKTKNRPGGYPKIWLDGKHVYVHRLVWKRENGEIPDGMHVLHKCDNPSCVNPIHLFLGSHADNMADKVAKGRTGLAKLSAEDVDDIRLNYQQFTTKYLADRFGVSMDIIRRAATGRSYAKLGRIPPVEGRRPGAPGRYRALSYEAILRILRERPRGHKARAVLAKEFGVHPSTIYRVLKQDAERRFDFWGKV